MKEHKNSFVANLLKKEDTNLNQEVSSNDSELNNAEKVETKYKQKGGSSVTLIQDCVLNYQKLEYSKSEKSNLTINPIISQKLKLVSIASKVSLFDLSNAILHEYLEDNKKEIAVILKKLSI